jgi:hypothetical protein
MQDGVAAKRAALTICPSWFLVQLTLGMGLLSLQKIQMGLARGNAAVAVRYASAIDSLSAAIQVFISPRVSEMLDVYGRQPVLIATIFGDKTTQTACGGGIFAGCWADCGLSPRNTCWQGATGENEDKSEGGERSWQQPVCFFEVVQRPAARLAH